MYWQAWSERLQSILNLANSPVAVTFTGALPDEALSGKLSVCQAIRRAADGERSTISVETCGCPGGLVSLGLGQVAPENHERLVTFLVEREKVYSSRVALFRSQQTVPAPVGLGSHVVFAPLAGAELRPDVVLFLGRPGSLHHLVGFANYWEGGSLKAELAGPACRTAVAYPIVTGEVGLTLLDFGARRLAHFADSELVLAIPFHRMLGIIRALDEGVGVSRDQLPDAVERQIDELGRVQRV